jgi:hypothetical protein
VSIGGQKEGFAEVAGVAVDSKYHIAFVIGEYYFFLCGTVYRGVGKFGAMCLRLGWLIGRRWR